MLIECIQTNDDFAGLKEDWNEILQRIRNDNIFLTWEWLDSWWQSFRENGTLFTVIVRDAQKKLLGIAPLMITKQSYHGIPFRQLQLIGSGKASSDYLGFIVDSEQEGVIQKLLAYLWNAKDKWDVFKLTDILIGCRVLEIAEKWTEETGWKYARESGLPCPYIPLTNSWEDYLKTLNGKMRYEMRRRLNLLKKDHDVRFILWQDTIGLESAVEIFFKLHSSRWGGNGNITAHQHVKEFHQKVARRFFNNNWLRLYFMEVDMKPVAALYGFEYQGKFFYYNCGFDLQWSKYGVAKQLLGWVIEDCVKRNLREFDFLKGSEEYKYEWTSHEKKAVQMNIFNRNVRSRLYRNAWRGISAFKKMLSEQS